MCPASCFISWIRRKKPKPYRGAFKHSWKLWSGDSGQHFLLQASLAYYLITITCKTAALHSTWVEVPLVVKLENRQSAVDIIEDRGKAPTQCQQLGSIAVEPDTHGTLKGEVSTIAEKRTGKREGKQVRWALQKNWATQQQNSLFNITFHSNKQAQ